MQDLPDSTKHSLLYQSAQSVISYLHLDKSLHRTAAILHHLSKSEHNQALKATLLDCVTSLQQTRETSRALNDHLHDLATNINSLLGFPPLHPTPAHSDSTSPPPNPQPATEKQ